MENVIEPSVESLLLDLKKRSLAELVTSADQYEELVDDLMGEKLEWGEYDDNEDLMALREDLVARWPEVQEYMRRNETDRP